MPKEAKMTFQAFLAQDFYLLPPEQQLLYFLAFLRKDRSDKKSPFPCKVTLKGKGTVALGSSKNTIRGAHIEGELIVITLKTPVWGKAKYEVFFHAGNAFCRIADIQGRGEDPEFIIEP